MVDIGRWHTFDEGEMGLGNNQSFDTSQAWDISQLWDTSQTPIPWQRTRKPLALVPTAYSQPSELITFDEGLPGITFLLAMIDITMFLSSFSTYRYEFEVDIFRRSLGFSKPSFISRLRTSPSPIHLTTPKRGNVILF